MLPARYRFWLFPGVSTAACWPRSIHWHPTFGFRFTSTSSMNTAVSSAGSPCSIDRSSASFLSRSGSFGRMAALSPLQYQKRFPLQEAHRLMLGEGLGAGEAAFRVGYESPSQFGREYRRLFGAQSRKDVTAAARSSADV